MSGIQHRELDVNGIRMHIAEQGSGPLVVLCHGWPEIWYSWRHQLPALAERGFHVVAPDMRGYGSTDAPEAVDAYTLLHLVGDITGLVTALGEQHAVLIGHDWGAPVVWNAATMRPDMFTAVVGMGVPHRARSPLPPLRMLREAGRTDYYWFHFQPPGVAEAEFERDVDTALRKLLYGVPGPQVDREHPLDVPRGGGFLDRLVLPPQTPAWLREKDIERLAGEFRRTGFRGGFNWYRNLDRNWELTAAWADVQVRQPALFIAGSRDPFIAGRRGAAMLKHMEDVVPGVRTQLIEGAGHWVQQEEPERVNQALLDFLLPLHRSRLH
ncbi:MAG TPA: alpha/beta hydrolase [Povalibacter sp.]|nr:alpha/beta hydrolase [Povalibacter sp.]